MQKKKKGVCVSGSVQILLLRWLKQDQDAHQKRTFSTGCREKRISSVHFLLNFLVSSSGVVKTPPAPQEPSLWSGSELSSRSPLDNHPSPYPDTWCRKTPAPGSSTGLCVSGPHTHTRMWAGLHTSYPERRSAGALKRGTISQSGRAALTGMYRHLSIGDGNQSERDGGLYWPVAFSFTSTAGINPELKLELLYTCCWADLCHIKDASRSTDKGLLKENTGSNGWIRCNALYGHKKANRQ